MLQLHLCLTYLVIRCSATPDDSAAFPLKLCLCNLQLGYMGGAYAMVIASVVNIVLTIGYVLAAKLVPRTWGLLTSEAFQVDHST